MDSQTDLSLRWAHMPFCWFCRALAHCVIAVRKVHCCNISDIFMSAKIHLLAIILFYVLIKIMFVVLKFSFCNFFRLFSSMNLASQASFYLTLLFVTVVVLDRQVSRLAPVSSD